MVLCLRQLMHLVLIVLILLLGIMFQVSPQFLICGLMEQKI
nr:MAG TPA: hypothetical protein [Caudoviricetes sp.]